MYKWSRSAMIAQGKAQEAVEFAGTIAAYITSNHVPVQVGMEMAGQWGRIHWFSEPESAAHWEEINLKLIGDEEYQALKICVRVSSNAMARAPKDELRLGWVGPACASLPRESGASTVTFGRKYRRSD